MKRLPLIILALLVLGSAGFGLAQLDEAQKLRQSVAAWEKERADLQKRIWELQKKNNELANRRAPAAVATTVTADAGPAGVEGPRDENGPPVAFRAGGRNEGGRFGAIMANPEVQKLMALQQKAGLDGRYSALFRQLQLNPADLEKFKNLLVEKQSAVMDVMAAARAEGLTGRENRDEIRQLVQQTQADVDNNIRSTLGETAYAQYQGYEATQSERTVVSQLEQRLSYSSTPLTDSQSQQLVQILAATAPTGGNNAGSRNATGGVATALALGGGGMTAFTGGGTRITADAVTQAQSILSAQQVSALQGLQQEQQASAQLRQQMRANFPGGPTTATSTSVTTTPRP